MRRFAEMAHMAGRIWISAIKAPAGLVRLRTKKKLPRLAARQSFFRRKAGLVPLLGAETTSNRPFAIFE